MRHGLLAICLLLSICLGVSFVCADSAGYPDLVGKWTGNSSGYYAGADVLYNETDGMPFTLTIPKQEGRTFKGSIETSSERYQGNFTLSGIIDHDMTTIYLAENGTGMDVAHIISPTDIEFIALDLKDGSTMVVNFTKKTNS